MAEPKTLDERFVEILLDGWRPLSPNSKTVDLQIYERLIFLASEGRLPPGTAVPALDVFIRLHGVSPRNNYTFLERLVSDAILVKTDTGHEMSANSAELAIALLDTTSEVILRKLFTNQPPQKHDQISRLRQVIWQIVIQIGRGVAPEGAEVPTQSTVAEALDLQQRDIGKAFALCVNRGLFAPKPKPGSDNLFRPGDFTIAPGAGKTARSIIASELGVSAQGQTIGNDLLARSISLQNLSGSNEAASNLITALFSASRSGDKTGQPGSLPPFYEFYSTRLATILGVGAAPAQKALNHLRSIGAISSSTAFTQRWLPARQSHEEIPRLAAAHNSFTAAQLCDSTEDLVRRGVDQGWILAQDPDGLKVVCNAHYLACEQASRQVSELSNLRLHTSNIADFETLWLNLGQAFRAVSQGADFETIAKAYTSLKAGLDADAEGLKLPSNVDAFMRLPGQKRVSLAIHIRHVVLRETLAGATRFPKNSEISPVVGADVAAVSFGFTLLAELSLVEPSSIYGRDLGELSGCLAGAGDETTIAAVSRSDAKQRAEMADKLADRVLATNSKSEVRSEFNTHVAKLAGILASAWRLRANAQPDLIPYSSQVVRQAAEQVADAIINLDSRRPGVTLATKPPVAMPQLNWSKSPPIPVKVNIEPSIVRPQKRVGWGPPRARP